MRGHSEKACRGRVRGTEKPETRGFRDRGPDDQDPVLAAILLTIARTYLLELMKHEGPNGRAARVDDHIQKAHEILNEYPTAVH